MYGLRGLGFQTFEQRFELAVCKAGCFFTLVFCKALEQRFRFTTKRLFCWFRKESFYLSKIIVNWWIGKYGVLVGGVKGLMSNSEL